VPAVDPTTAPYPPTTYGLDYVAFIVFLIALIVGWYLILPLLARRAKEKPPKPVPVPKPVLAPVDRAREAALEEIAAIERAVGAREIDVRDAHLRLSATLREFALAVTGVDARTMTLRELRASDLDAIAAAVAQYYPIAFGVTEHSRLGPASEIAREVVRSWR